MAFDDLLSPVLSKQRSAESQKKLDLLCRKTLRILDQHGEFNKVPPKDAEKLAKEWGVFAKEFEWGKSKLEAWERRAKDEVVSPFDLKGVKRAEMILRDMYD